MTKNHVLILFAAAGLILALVFGVYAYRANSGPTQSGAAALVEDFIGKISSGRLSEARDLMTAETRAMLREPGTLLGETVYRDLKLRSVGQLYDEGNGCYAADVVLTAPDTLKIMTKAGMLFAERVAEQGPSADPDQDMAEIYAEILARDDVPMLDNFCVIRMEMRNGQLYIAGDAALQQALEGSISSAGSALDRLLENSGQ